MKEDTTMGRSVAQDPVDRPVRVGVFDAGIGGIPLAARLHELLACQVVYLGDAARRPYGPRSLAEVGLFVAQAEEFFRRKQCDLWVIACNTASVVAGAALSGQLPCVDMISAVRSGLPQGESDRPVGLIGTAATVASGAYPRALEGRTVHQLATEELLRIAEEGGGQRATIRRLASHAFDQLRRRGCVDVILACTDYTCVLADLEAVADGLRLFDPLEAAARLTLDWAASRHSGGSVPADELYLTGPHPVDVPRFAAERYRLRWPEATIVTLDA